jgi:hypothetical protein
MVQAAPGQVVDDVGEDAGGVAGRVLAGDADEVLNQGEDLFVIAGQALLELRARPSLPPRRCYYNAIGPGRSIAG